MFNYSKTMIAVAAWTLLPILATSAAAQATDGGQHKAIIRWVADLTHNDLIPAQTPATGRVVFIFDFTHKTVKISVDSQNLHNVQSIELRRARTDGDFDGPIVVVIYRPRDGAFKSKYNKIVTGALFNEVANVVPNGQGVVKISTAAYPNGELVGAVLMHKSYQ
jgi:hypothetical protein